MSDLVFSATFTKTSGIPAEGLTLADIDFYLTAVNKSTLADTVIWDGTQNPTEEIDNIGAYARRYDSADYSTYTYYARATYTGATDLDSDNVTGVAGVAVDDIADAVWDEILTAATHNVATSAGRRLRTVAQLAIREEMAQGPGTGTNQIQLDSGASAVDGAYDPAIVVIVAGTGTGQARLILEYDGATKTATVDRDWKVNPDATSEFQIIGNPGREHVNEGLARAGTGTTITLNTLASSDDDAYIDQIVFIRSGTGADQARRVVDYDGTDKIATINGRNWDVTPDTTSGYVMLPTGMTEVTNDSINAEVDTALSDYDGPTNAEMDTAHALLSTSAALSTHDGKLDTVDANVDAVLVDTGTTIPASIAALNDLSSAEVNAEMVDVLTVDTLADSYAADGAQPTIGQAVLAIKQFLEERAVSGTTVTVKKPDGSTAAMTFTLSDADDPTSITRAS